MKARTFVLLAALCACDNARADGADVDVSKFYEVKASATPAKLKVGEKGTATIEIPTAPNAHVAPNAPLTIELTGKQVETAKANLTMADSVGKAAPGQEFATPRFEIPFSAKAAGKGELEAKMKFFVCVTDKICKKQLKTVTIDVEVQ